MKAAGRRAIIRRGIECTDFGDTAAVNGGNIRAPRRRGRCRRYRVVRSGDEHDVAGIDDLLRVCKNSTALQWRGELLRVRGYLARHGRYAKSALPEAPRERAAEPAGADEANPNGFQILHSHGSLSRLARQSMSRRPRAIAVERRDIRRRPEPVALGHRHASATDRQQVAHDELASGIRVAVEFEQAEAPRGRQCVQRSEQRYSAAEVMGAIALARFDRLSRDANVSAHASPFRDIRL